MRTLKTTTQWCTPQPTPYGRCATATVEPVQLSGRPTTFHPPLWNMSTSRRRRWSRCEAFRLARFLSLTILILILILILIFTLTLTLILILALTLALALTFSLTLTATLTLTL